MVVSFRTTSLSLRVYMSIDYLGSIVIFWMDIKNEL